MLLGNLIKCSNKNYRKITVKGIAFDSRKVKRGYIFFAIKGNKTSGIKFVNEAFTEDGDRKDDMIATPNKKACKWCEFRKTEYCSEGI